MTLGYNVKKGLLILNEEGTIENKVKKEFYNKPYDDAGDGDYHKIKSLSEKAHELLEKRKRKEMESKSVDVYKEISNKPIVINDEKECLTSKNDKYVIDYSEAKGRKDFIGQPIDDTDSDIVFQLHREVVVDSGMDNLKGIVDFTLNTLDNILNASSIPMPIKTAINTSLKTLVNVLSISSINKWISFLRSIQKILGVAVNCSDSIKSFVDRVGQLSGVSENCYRNSTSINSIYSNAFSDLSSKYSTIGKVKNNKYTMEEILNTI